MGTGRVWPVPSRLLITLNVRVRPLDRGERYEDPLEAALEALAPGSEVTGGGTLLTADREPAQCDIDLDIHGDAEAALRLAITTLEAAGAPKGSLPAPGPAHLDRLRDHTG